jgi:hypothetical protein
MVLSQYSFFFLIFLIFVYPLRSQYRYIYIFYARGGGVEFEFIAYTLWKFNNLSCSNFDPF